MNQTIGSVQALSLNHGPNLWFSSGWFGFKPKFRTKLFHHYLFHLSVYPFPLVYKTCLSCSYNPVCNQLKHQSILLTWKPILSLSTLFSILSLPLKSKTTGSHSEGTTHKLKLHLYPCVEVHSVNLCLLCPCNQIHSVRFCTTAQFWPMEQKLTIVGIQLLSSFNSITNSYSPLNPLIPFPCLMQLSTLRLQLVLLTT